MYFYNIIEIKYYMLTTKRIILLLLLVAVCIATPIMATCRKQNAVSEERGMQVLTLWQIDSFEGGKGSRAQYLQNKANEFFDGENCYLTVASLSADAARKNMKVGNIPDIISYGAGFYGLDKYVNACDFAYKSWCRGGYCILSLTDNDFKDVDEANTVINEGKDNLTKTCALLCGVEGAHFESSTSAYVSLINGKYKYLLGTQRDIFRLKTRGVSFSVKPITVFNDLYQNISILTNGEKYYNCLKFINWLIENNNDLAKVGMIFDKKNIYDDEMQCMQDVSFDCTIKGFVSQSYLNEINSATKSNDINLLKKLLK